MRNENVFSVEIKMDGEHPLLVQHKNGRQQEAFATEVFVNIVWTENEGCETALFHFIKNCEPTISGSEIRGFRFNRDVVDSISVELAERKLVYGDILRLCAFAQSDLGAFLVSAYPNVKNMARQMVMLASHKPANVALAQHFVASWMLDIYATLKE